MKIVIALGGNALGNTPSEQIELAKEAAMSIVNLIEQGHEVILVHGNGTQVGMIKNAFDESSKINNEMPLMPLAECVAMSQGYIGYHLQIAIKNALLSRKIEKNVTAIITHVVVDKDDEAFKYPTKPIGIYYSKEEAKKRQETLNEILVEDSGRGYRIVVPSPKPIDIVEKNIIEKLFGEQNIIITVGGGGIPVIYENEQYRSVSAVVDKDMAGAKLALLVDADLFLILTAVRHVCINYGTSSEEKIHKMSSEEAKIYIEEGHFPSGSMLPKVKAAIEFAEQKSPSRSIIACLQEADLAVKGKAGTVIYF